MWKRIYHAQSDGCLQHLKCSLGKWWKPSLKDKVKAQIFSWSDRQTEPNHSCSCHVMFDFFFCPSETKFNFVTAIDKEIIFFNYLRYGPNGKWDDRFLPWNQFLNVAEGVCICGSSQECICFRLRMVCSATHICNFWAMHCSDIQQ